jgi:hypothetical protein
MGFALKGRYICKQLKKKCNALSGLHRWLIFTQGVALGCYGAALSGLR